MKILSRALAICTSFWLLPGASALRAQTLCTEVKLEIKQEAALEREAFDAVLEVVNEYPAYGLTGFRVDISIKDPQGAPADDLFFVKLNSKEGVTAVDGSGVVQPVSTATVRWLIIPSTGSGGSCHVPPNQGHSIPT